MQDYLKSIKKCTVEAVKEISDFINNYWDLGLTITGGVLLSERGGDLLPFFNSYVGAGMFAVGTAVPLLYSSGKDNIARLLRNVLGGLSAASFSNEWYNTGILLTVATLFEEHIRNRIATENYNNNSQLINQNQYLENILS